MITVCVTTQQQSIRKITLTGHANSAEYGKDLVCAGASAIAFGLLNALDELAEEVECIVSENCISIDVKQVNSVNQLILQTGIIQWKTLVESVPQFIEMKLQED